MEVRDIRVFIDKLFYDLATVQYLLDYGRIKETVGLMDKILNSISSFKTQAGGQNSKLQNVFNEDFWQRTLPDGMTFLEMRELIRQYAQKPPEGVEENLDKAGYLRFIEEVAGWSSKNVHKIQYAIKPSVQKKAEKALAYLVLGIIGLTIIAGLGRAFITRNDGLRGDFYEGENFEKYAFSAHKRTINFSSPANMDPRISHDHFSVRWQGDILIPHDGNYEFFIEVDDGVRLFIDGKRLINVWVPGCNKGNQKIFLNKGTHKIVLEYFQNRSGAYLRLFWAINGGVKEIITDRYLRVIN